MASISMLGAVFRTVMTCAVLVTSVAYCADGICPDGMYLPVDDVICRWCSRCPDNLVIKEVCSGDRDTVCGPLRDFIFQQEYGLEEGSDGQDLETEDEESSAIRVVSVVMIVLLSVTSIICITLVVLIVYKRTQEKKEGLMYSSENISDSQPGCSGWHADNEVCRREPPSLSSQDDLDQPDNFKLTPITPSTSSDVNQVKLPLEKIDYTTIIIPTACKDANKITKLALDINTPSTSNFVKIPALTIDVNKIHKEASDGNNTPSTSNLIKIFTETNDVNTIHKEASDVNNTTSTSHVVITPIETNNVNNTPSTSNVNKTRTINTDVNKLPTETNDVTKTPTENIDVNATFTPIETDTVHC